MKIGDIMDKTGFIGKTYTSDKHGNLVITNYINANKVEVEFRETGFKTVTKLEHIKNGKVKDKFKPNVQGVGIIGDEVSRVNGKLTKEYSLWQSMLRRCYDESFHKTMPTYKTCSVSEDFKFYPIFKEWCRKQVSFNLKGFTLDKDLLVKGNREYSAETCCFLPEEINLVLVKCDGIRGDYPIGVSFDVRQNAFSSSVSVGSRKKHLGYFETSYEAFVAYKDAKERLLKELAEEYKEVIDVRAYKALLDYKVELDD